MGSNQYDAQAEQYKRQAQAARKQAGLTGTEAVENLQDFRLNARKTLSTGAVNLARSGSLGWERRDQVGSGVDVGSKMSEETKQITSSIESAREKIPELQEQLETIDKYETYEETVQYHDTGPEQVTRRRINPEWQSTKDQIDSLKSSISTGQSKLNKAWEKMEDLEDVSMTQAGEYAVGSDALAMSRATDTLEKTRRKYMRKVQRNVYTMLDNADAYKEQAAAASEAADTMRRNQVAKGIFGTILGGAMMATGAGAFGAGLASPSLFFGGAGTATRSWF